MCCSIYCATAVNCRVMDLADFISTVAVPSNLQMFEDFSCTLLGLHCTKFSFPKDLLHMTNYFIKVY